MILQLINIAFPDIFKRYSRKYNIFRDLLEYDFVGLEVRNIQNQLAESIRKYLLSKNEICFVSPSAADKSDLLLMNNFTSLFSIANGIKGNIEEGLGLSLSNTLNNYVNYDSIKYKINDKNFTFDAPYLMGILNVTPDSFSDGGKYLKLEKAFEHAEFMIQNGADIIDVGGESTRPGSESVSAEEEKRRVIPVIEKIHSMYPSAVISIDTTKSDVAEQALISGASIVNDISGFSFDNRILEVTAEFNASCILMHIKGRPKNMQDNPFYEDAVNEVYNDLYYKTKLAESYGISNIIIDPGIGFGKRVSDNFELIRRLNEFKGIGKPVLVGLSRKSFLGKSLNLEVEERDVPTAIAETYAVANGARIIRTHNVRNGSYIKQLSDFFNNPREPINV